MYLVYLFKEKETGEIIYVGSTSRPMPRMKEHKAQIRGDKKRQPIHEYIFSKGYSLYNDVEVIFHNDFDNEIKMHEKEKELYYKFKKTLKNCRPAEDRNGSFNPKSRKIINNLTGEIYKTVTECSEKMKISRTSINRILNKETKGFKNVDISRYSECND